MFKIDKFKNINNLFLISVFLLGILVAFVCAYIFYFKPKLLDKNNIQYEIEGLSVDLIEKRKIESGYSEYHEKTAFFKDNFLFHTLGFIKHANQDKKLIELLTGQSITHSLNIKYLKFYSVKNEPTFSVTRVELIVVGDARDINNFLIQIIDAKTAIWLKKFKLDFLTSINSDSTKQQNLSLLLDIYSDKPTEPLNISFSSQGINLSKSKKIEFRDKNYLKQSSIEQFKLVGFLKGGFFERKYALIELPNKILYKAAINDEIGLEKFRIISIQNESVITQGIEGKKLELKLNN